VRTQPASKLVILGAGGHGRVVADAALAQGAWAQVLATDRDPRRCGGELLPGVALVPFDTARALDGAAMHAAIGDAAAREREIRAWGDAPGTVLHPRASVSVHAQIGPGCFIAAQAVVGPGARLGTGVIVNHGAVVDHDVAVGDFTHVAPLASLSGGARVGARVLVGTGARVLPGVGVCDDVTIGAGAVVCKAIEAPGVYAGVPARRIR
jgi:sugar O-acyltransferase (sialic acid O-acetyltransferase NeuD family)